MANDNRELIVWRLADEVRRGVIAITESERVRIEWSFKRQFFFFSSRRRHTRWTGDWSSDVCSSDLELIANRTGFNEKQQIEVVHRDLTGDALIERVAQLAEKLGVDKNKFLGVSHETKVRSEERRVGKECRCRRGAYKERKKRRGDVV